MKNVTAQEILNGDILTRKWFTDQKWVALLVFFLVVLYVYSAYAAQSQQRHIDDLKDVEEYIISILEEEVLAIEFYTNGKNRFGGDIARSDGAAISIDYLAKHFHYPAEYLSQFDYEVYSWSGKYDDTRQKCQ